MSVQEVKAKDILQLSDGNEYVICSKAIYNKELYIYLADTKDLKNIRFCKFESENEDYSVEDVEDPELLGIILPLLNENGEQVLSELLSE